MSIIYSEGQSSNSLAITAAIIGIKSFRMAASKNQTPKKLR
jgi:hypothetical protein